MERSKGSGNFKNTFTLPYGRKSINFTLPEGIEGIVIDPNPSQVLSNLEEAIKDSLQRPINSPPFKEFVQAGQKVCIVVTDMTRACPDHLILPPLIEELKASGIKEEDVTILIGLGLHRPMTYQEKVKKLGRDIVERYEVMDHDPFDPQGIIDLGQHNGVPLTVSKVAYDADILIATGIVEPHQYVGYSGGFKTVSIGAGGEATINYTHSLKMIDDHRIRLGSIENNPFQEAMGIAARKAGLRFIINIVTNGDGELVAVRAGEPASTFSELVKIAKRIYEVPVYEEFDVVICGVGYPKDTNLYQASRVASYIFFAPKRVIKDEGIIVILAPCDEGVGEGAGEKRFYELMTSERDAASLLNRIKKNGIDAGEQRAFIMARVLEACDVVVVGSNCPEAVKALHMIPVENIEETFGLINRRFGGRARALVIPHPFHSIPV